METITFLGGENFARGDDGCGEWIVRRIGALGTSELLFGMFADVYSWIVRGQVTLFGDSENCFVTKQLAWGL